MNKFEKQLEKWNNGVLRGAQAKLAKTLGVSTATTALWATGKRRPSKGYVSKMSALFKLDEYRVVKLFENSLSTVYPLPTSNVNLLREVNADTAYQVGTSAEETAQSNSVQIPFLNAPTAALPYSEDNVIEWWSLPRRYAQGTKYIVRSCDIGLADATSPDDLCFVKPTDQPADKQVMLLFNGKKEYIVRRAIKKANVYRYVFISGKNTLTPRIFHPIGIITRRIKPL